MIMIYIRINIIVLGTLLLIMFKHSLGQHITSKKFGFLKQWQIMQVLLKAMVKKESGDKQIYLCQQNFIIQINIGIIRILQ